MSLTTPSITPSASPPPPTYSPTNEDGKLLSCPLSLAVFGERSNAFILLEEGRAYKESSITEWTRRYPQRTPFNQPIERSTLRLDRSITSQQTNCPLTGQPYEDPYHCLEDGYSYNLKSLRQHLEQMAKGGSDYFQIPVCCSPVTGEVFEQLTLYPNRTLPWKEAQPREQKPVVFRLEDLSPFPISDREIVLLIRDFHQSRRTDMRMEYLNKILARRKELGVPPTFREDGADPSLPDLSGLDLTNQVFRNRYYTSMRCISTCFHLTIFDHCVFYNVQFFNCDLTRVLFQNCSFMGPNTRFYQSDLRGAVFLNHQSFEVGEELRLVRTVDEFRNELKWHGALHTDEVSFR